MVRVTVRLEGTHEGTAMLVAAIRAVSDTVEGVTVVSFEGEEVAVCEECGGPMPYDPVLQANVCRHPEE